MHLTEYNAEHSLCVSLTYRQDLFIPRLADDYATPGKQKRETKKETCLQLPEGLGRIHVVVDARVGR